MEFWLILPDVIQDLNDQLHTLRNNPEIYSSWNIQLMLSLTALVGAIVNGWWQRTNCESQNKSFIHKPSLGRLFWFKHKYTSILLGWFFFYYYFQVNQNWCLLFHSFSKTTMRQIFKDTLWLCLWHISRKKQREKLETCSHVVTLNKTSWIKNNWENRLLYYPRGMKVVSRKASFQSPAHYLCIGNTKPNPHPVSLVNPINSKFFAQHRQHFRSNVSSLKV